MSSSDHVKKRWGGGGEEQKSSGPVPVKYRNFESYITTLYSLTTYLYISRYKI